MPSSRELIKRQQIQAASEKLFLQHGYAATSMDAIAAEAGVSKPTLYRYYVNKEVLLTAVLEQLIHNLSLDHDVPDINEAALNEREDLRQLLDKIANRFVATLMQPDYLALMRVIIFENANNPQLGQVFRNAISDKISKSIEAILTVAREKGLADFRDPFIAARIFIGSLLTYVLHDGLLRTASFPQPPEPEQLAEMIRMVMKAIG